MKNPVKVACLFAADVTLFAVALRFLDATPCDCFSFFAFFSFSTGSDAAEASEYFSATGDPLSASGDGTWADLFAPFNSGEKISSNGCSGSGESSSPTVKSTLEDVFARFANGDLFPVKELASLFGLLEVLFSVFFYLLLFLLNQEPWLVYLYRLLVGLMLYLD